MSAVVIDLLLKVVTSSFMENLIAKGLNWLVEHKTAGIGQELAKTAINAVAKSQANPTTEDMFKSAMEVL